LEPFPTRRGKKKGKKRELFLQARNGEGGGTYPFLADDQAREDKKILGKSSQANKRKRGGKRYQTYPKKEINLFDENRKRKEHHERARKKVSYR